MLSGLLLAAACLSNVSAAASLDVPSLGQPLQVSPERLLALAGRAQEKGNLAFADAAYRALTSNPNSNIRNEARFRRAKLLANMRRLTEAATLLRQILDERPDATAVRLALAQLLDRLGDKDGAWRELRAAQAAGLPPAVARMVDRYSEALRSTRSAGASIEIALAPDSNISNSTDSDTLGTVIGEFEIDPDSKAQSGTGLAVRGQAYRRFRIRGDQTFIVRGAAAADLYADARFDDVALDIAAGPELTLGRSRLAVEAGFTTRSFGHKPYLRSPRVAVSWTRRVGRRSQVRAAASASSLNNQVNDAEDGPSFSGQMALEHALTPSLGVSASFAAARHSSREPAYSTTGWRSGLLAWRDMGRVTITAGVEVGGLGADERLILFKEKRADNYTRASLGATFRQLSFKGFAPLVRLVVERNRSNIEVYDYSRRRAEFGLARAF